MESMESVSSRKPAGSTAEGMAETIAMLSRQKKNTYLINPLHSSRLAVWDAIIGVLLCYTALVTPFEVAFLALPKTWKTVRFFLNRFVDCMFVIDMFIQVRGPPAP